MSPTVQKSYALPPDLPSWRCWHSWRLSPHHSWPRRIAIPRPEGIQSDVNFWIRVYTEVTTNEGFLHDERNLAVVYDTLKFGAGGSSRERQRTGGRAARPAHRRPATHHRRAADRGRARSALRGRQAPARAVGSESQRHHSQGSDHPHSLPAGPVRPFQGRSDPFVELGNPYRRDFREPGPAARARSAAARRVVVQRRRLLEGGRRGPLAVHAFHRPALHARRRCGGRAPRSRTARRKPRPNYWPTTTACSAAGRWRSPRTTTAPPACAARRNPWARTTSSRSTAPTAAALSASLRAISSRRSWPR